MDNNIYREGPSVLEVEAAFLGAILRNEVAFLRVVDRLEPHHFFAEEHREIWRACQDKLAAGGDVNPVTIGIFARDQRLFENVGGAKYLHELAANIISVINVDDYADQILAAWQARASLASMASAIEVINSDQCVFDLGVGEAVERLDAELGHIFDAGDRSGPVTMAKATQTAIDVIERAYRSAEPTGLKTGLSDLDRHIGGLQNGVFYILAGRPSMGKSALAFGAAFDIARGMKDTGDKGRVMIVSAETKHEKIVKRELARMTGITSQHQDRGDLSAEEFDELMLRSREINDLPIVIDDSASPTVAKIRARALRLSRRRGVRLLIVDHIQLIRDPLFGTDRTREIGAISHQLQALAKELDCPVVVLSQLSRGVEAREDKRPMLADLRESGDIEQDADVVLFVYREEYYLSRAEPRRRSSESDEVYHGRLSRHNDQLEAARGHAELIVAKNRDGATGEVHVAFRGARYRFSDIEIDEDDAAPDPAERQKMEGVQS